MRVELTLKDALSGVQQSVVVEGPDDMTLDALAQLLTSRAPSSGPLFLNNTPLRGTGRIASLPPLDGATVMINSPAPPSVSLDGPRVLVAGGPDAGAVIALPAAGVVGGRGAECGMRIADPAMRRAGDFGVISQAGQVYLSDEGSTNGIYLDGQPVQRSTVLEPGQRWFAGQSEFCFLAAASPDAAVRRGGDGGVVMTRQFRSIPVVRPVEVDWPALPADEERAPFPWLQVLLPLLFSAVMLVIFFVQPSQSRNPIFLVFACSSPLLILSSVFTDRRRRARQLARANLGYEQRCAATVAAVRAALADELAARQRRVPTVAELVEAAVTGGSRIWERRPRDEDYLELRLGTADLPAASPINRGRPVPPPVMRSAPVSLRLAELGCIGLYGADQQVRSVARSLVCQLAALHGPDDLQLAVLLRDASHVDWEWLRWLPHLRRENGALAVGLDVESSDARIAELAAIIEHRDQQQRPGGGRQVAPVPSIVAVVEDASELRDNPLMSRVLSRGPELGVFVVACERRRAQLPQECRAAVEVPTVDHFDAATLEVQAVATIHPIRLDGMSAATAEKLARSLTPLRLAGETSEAATGIPGIVRLLDLVGHRDGSAARLKATWDLGGRSTAVTIGQGANGPFTLDIKNHGPHALVAGTAGAGKSQLLMSLVLGLALQNTPEDLNFVLIDFKGGGAFEACADLPHTARMVTNLGGGEARRAVTALRAESLRRQQLFSVFGADIDNYDRARRAGDARAALKIPRLVIVVDEFAQLAEEYEDLLDEFVNVARVGRSLGMHMVLATQRPSGIVSPQIRSNCDLRIALRVTDPADSVDVIERPDAYKIPKAARGRAFVRAADELFEVQTAAVGLPVPGIAAAIAKSTIRLRPWVETPSPPPSGPSSPGESNHLETDLQLGVALVQEATRIGGYVLPPSPVLPPLPELILLGELDESRPGAAPIGLEDRPAEQIQRAFDVHPGDGHLLIVGSPRSGRTTAVRTLVASLAVSWGPADLHIYGFDFGGGGLRPLESVPHVGAIVGQNQVDRSRRLADRLGGLMRDRMRLFQQLGVGDLAEQRARGVHPLPYVVVVVDRWDVLVERDASGAELSNAIRRLITEGGAFGISVVISSDSRRARALTSDISRSLCFSLNDKAEYTDFGIRSRDVPDSLPPGRALRGGDATEVQIALLASDPAAGAQNAALDAAFASAGPFVDPKDLPFRVDELPGNVSLTDMGQLQMTVPDGVPIAVGGDSLRAMCWSPSDQPVFVVAGPPGSGRTTALEAAIASLAGSVRIAVVDPSAGRLSALGGLADLQSGMDGRGPRFDHLREWTEPTLLVIDDLDQVADDSRLAEFLGDRPTHVVVLCSVNADSLKMALRGAMGRVANTRHGLLLNPQGLQHRGILGLNSLDRSDVISDAPGKGYWVSPDGITLVQVARK